MHHVGCLGNDESNDCSPYVSISSFLASDHSLGVVILAEKYCTLVRNENGEPLLSQIRSSKKMTAPIRQLAEAALANVQR